MCVIGHKTYGTYLKKASLKGWKSDLSINFGQLPFQVSENNADQCRSGSTTLVFT